MMLHLSVVFVAVIQLSSSQYTYDINMIETENNVSRCDCAGQVLGELRASIAQLQKRIDELEADKRRYSATGSLNL